MMNAMGSVGMDVLAGSCCVVTAVFILGVMIMTHVAERNSFKHVVYYHMTSAVVAIIHVNLEFSAIDIASYFMELCYFFISF